MKPFGSTFIGAVASALLLVSGAVAANAEPLRDGIVLVQSGSNVKSFTKKKIRGGESCTIKCKDGTTASQSCTDKKPNCDCGCYSGGARCNCH